MNSQIFGAQSTWAIVLALFLFLGACASNAEKKASATKDPGSTKFEEQSARAATPRCGVGYMLTCEAARTGRIRFGRMKPANLESCSCEPESSIPANSPLPGLH